MDNATRKQLLQRHKMSGFPGSIMDVFKAYEQGVDLIDQYQQQQQMQVAQTPQQRQQGLRPAHQAGNTNASMAFPNTKPNASFNTVGMKAPIDMKQFDDRGNLVKSYDAVPPGVTDLKMSSQGGTVIETPTQMQNGGEYNMNRALELGYTADETGHWPSVDYTNGMWLKSSKHPTAIKEFLHGYLGGDHYKTHNIVTNPQGHFGENQLQYVPKQEIKDGGARGFQKYEGMRKYQDGSELTYGQTSPDWRATSPRLRINGQTYQNSQLTGATRVPINPETGDQLPIMLPAAEVVGRRNYDDSIQEAISRTNSGLLGSQTSAQDYAQMENAVRSGMNTAGNNMMTAGFDLLSGPQRYAVNAPLAYAKGKTPNLSMFPSTDRSLGINEPNAYPSETLGVNNPIAAFAVDALTDPGMMAGLGAGAMRLGKYAGRQLNSAATRMLNNPSSDLAKQLNGYRGRIIDAMFPAKPKDLGDVSLASKEAKDALRRAETINGAEGNIRNPAFAAERYRLDASMPGKGNVRRAMLDRMMGRYPEIPDNLRLNSKSGTFNATMRYPNPSEGTPGRLGNFTFIDNSKLAAGRIASELSEMVPKLEGDWVVNPGSLSGDSYPLWHNILSRKIPNTPQFTAYIDPHYPIDHFNSLGKFSSLSQKMRNPASTSAQEIVDMTQRISAPTFQRYGIVPPSHLNAGDFPNVSLYKQYRTGGVAGYFNNK